MVAAIERRSANGVLGQFTLAIDVTKLISVAESSAGYMTITGVEHSNALIDIKGMIKEDIHEILDGKLAKNGKLLAATEHTPAGVSPTEIIAACPQSNNESNEFIKDMERSTLSAVQLSGAGAKTFNNFAVDETSCKSHHIWTALCDFLS
eukprot:2279129-Ditylum_brightwellii.AAC.1